MAMAFTEAEVISVLQRVFATSDPRLLVGIGDDGAVIQGAPKQVITTDVAVAGVHFRTEWSSAFDIGRKITAANLADVLAMGATCDYLVAAVTLTGSEDLQWIEQLALGMKSEADRVGALIVGGDITRSSVITIAMTAVGHCDAPILRSGARPGDDIFISSLTGWSAAGLTLLSQMRPSSGKVVAHAIAEFSAPTLDYNLDFTGATALCDISDSLIIQGEQLAAASGVCLSLETELIQSSTEFADLSNLATETGSDIWDWILGGGEDHVFLATGKDLPGIKIGSVIEGSGISGIEMKKAPVSWSHFN
jgi:thiamine-monophosphate kinase